MLAELFTAPECDLEFLPISAKILAPVPHAKHTQGHMPLIENVSTKKKKNIVDVTDYVQKLLKSSSIRTHGLCHVFTMHTTAAITTADLDPGTDLDMLDAFDKMVPKLNYRHPHNPAHVPDHIMSSVIGPGVFVPVQDGELLLGTWQRIVLVELDGPRERKMAVSFIKSDI